MANTVRITAMFHGGPKDGEEMVLNTLAEELQFIGSIESEPLLCRHQASPNPFTLNIIHRYRRRSSCDCPKQLYVYVGVS